MKQIRGLIFDLDGTLVTSSLDFSAIRREIDCPPEVDVLTYLDQLSEPQRLEAQAVIHQHELRDAHDCDWIPGAQAFLERCADQALPMAIVTRNSAESSRIKIEKTAIPIDFVITRENSKPKPDPSALLELAERFQLQPRELMMIGDYKYDLQAARNADMYACLINYQVLPDYAHLADYTFATFEHLNEALFSRSL